MVRKRYRLGCFSVKLHARQRQPKLPHLLHLVLFSTTITEMAGSGPCVRRSLDRVFWKPNHQVFEIRTRLASLWDPAGMQGSFLSYMIAVQRIAVPCTSYARLRHGSHNKSSSSRGRKPFASQDLVIAYPPIPCLTECVLLFTFACWRRLSVPLRPGVHSMLGRLCQSAHLGRLDF